MLSNPSSLIYPLDLFTSGYSAYSLPLNKTPASKIKKATILLNRDLPLHHLCTTEIPHIWEGNFYNLLILLHILWWRRRESNPRPKTFRIGIYILSLNFSFRLFKSPPGRMLKRLSCKNIRRSVNRNSGPAILLVDALTKLAGMVRQDASLKRLERSYNHLRLCLISHLFYKPAGAWYATCASLSPSKPFRPHKVVQMYYLNLARADFTASAALQGICGNTLQLHFLRLAYATNSTLERSSY